MSLALVSSCSSPSRRDGPQKLEGFFVCVLKVKESLRESDTAKFGKSPSAL